MSMQNSKTNLFVLGTKELQAYCVARYITQIGGLSMALQEIKAGQKQKRITRIDAKRKRDYLKKAFAMYSNVTETVTPTTTESEIKPSASMLKSGTHVTETVTPQVLQIDFGEFKTAKELCKYCAGFYIEQKGGLDVFLQRLDDAIILGLNKEKASRFRWVMTSANRIYKKIELTKHLGALCKNMTQEKDSKNSTKR